MSASFQSAKVIPGEQGRRRNVLGDNQRVLLTGEDTGGSYALIEDFNPPGMGIPLHLHRNEDEMFYVVEGQVEFRIGTEILRAGAGTTVHMPRDTPHAFTIIGDVPAKRYRQLNDQMMQRIRACCIIRRCKLQFLSIAAIASLLRSSATRCGSTSASL